jgi:cobalt/nickel transport system permease protein
VGRSDTVVPVPAARIGFVSRFDPRWKLAATIVAMCAALSLHQLPIVLLALLLTLALVFAAGLPLQWVVSRLATVCAAVALFTLPLPLLLNGPGPSWEFGPLQFSAYGAEVGFLMAARALTIVSLSLILLTTTSADALLKAAHSVGFPGLLVQIALMTYRYLFVLMNELHRLRVAVRVRGFRNRPSRHSYRTAGQVAGTLLVRGYERADRVHHAMLCRGFDGQFRTLAAFRTGLVDVLAFLAIAGIAFGLCVMDRVIF